MGHPSQVKELLRKEKEMMMKIWKYSIIAPTCDFEMPINAQILCVQVQRDIPQIWALVNSDNPKTIRKIRVYGTGHDIPDNPGIYIGTFQVNGGTYIYHVFEEK